MQKLLYGDCYFFFSSVIFLFIFFLVDDMTIAYDHETGLSIVWSKLNMILNGDEVVSVEGYAMERAADDHDVRVERKANEGFVLMWNKVW